MQDSEPPASIMLASPKAMVREASPMECAPVVQAVVGAWLGPWGLVREGGDKGRDEQWTLKPYFMDRWPAARLMRSLGTKRGETFLAPCV